MVGFFKIVSFPVQAAVSPSVTKLESWKEEGNDCQVGDQETLNSTLVFRLAGVITDLTARRIFSVVLRRDPDHAYSTSP